VNAHTRHQRGSTIIEFSLVLLVFLTFALGVMDFARMMYSWNAATEAARMGARYAVVCDDTFNKPDVLARMQALMPQVADIEMDWTPAGCTASTCEGVTVKVSGMNYQWISPIFGLAGLPAIPMPTFSTYLTREVMRQDPNSASICP
jgi:Flp pilus assembly protein TadG